MVVGGGYPMNNFDITNGQSETVNQKTENTNGNKGHEHNQQNTTQQKHKYQQKKGG